MVIKIITQVNQSLYFVYNVSASDALYETSTQCLII